jgi:peptidoglycan/LPS O-acetylase OafA/YrhL
MEYYQAANAPTVVIAVLISAIVCGAFAAVVAGSKNRNKGNWFWAGLLFNIVALIAIAGMPSLPPPKPELPRFAQVLARL